MALTRRQRTASCAAFEARMILAEIALENLGEQSLPWKKWLAKQTVVPATKLTRVAPTSW